MKNLLGGNYDIEVIAEKVIEKFEDEVLKKLGGSIAFVKKDKLVWEDE